MISTEKVFDMLPYAVNIYEKLKVDEYFKTTKSKDKLGFDFFKYLISNLPKVKDEVFNVVALYEGKKVAEIRKQEVSKTIATVKALFNEEGLLDFFNQAM